MQALCSCCNKIDCAIAFHYCHRIRRHFTHDLETDWIEPRPKILTTFKTKSISSISSTHFARFREFRFRKIPSTKVARISQNWLSTVHVTYMHRCRACACATNNVCATLATCSRLRRAAVSCGVRSFGRCVVPFGTAAACAFVVPFRNGGGVVGGGVVLFRNGGGLCLCRSISERRRRCSLCLLRTGQRSYYREKRNAANCLRRSFVVRRWPVL